MAAVCSSPLWGKHTWPHPQSFSWLMVLISEGDTHDSHCQPYHLSTPTQGFLPFLSTSELLVNELLALGKPQWNQGTKQDIAKSPIRVTPIREARRLI